MGRKKGVKNKPKVPAPPEVAPYSATVKVLGKLYTSTGYSPLEAIVNLKVTKARGVTVLTITKGIETQEKVFNRLMTVRMFSPSTMMREVALKQATARFSL